MEPYWAYNPEIDPQEEQLILADALEHRFHQEVDMVWRTDAIESARQGRIFAPLKDLYLVGSAWYPLSKEKDEMKGPLSGWSIFVQKKLGELAQVDRRYSVIHDKVDQALSTSERHRKLSRFIFSRPEFNKAPSDDREFARAVLDRKIGINL